MVTIRTIHSEQIQKSTILPRHLQSSSSYSTLQAMSQSSHKSVVQSSLPNITQKRNQLIANQRRQNLSAINNDFRTQHLSPPFSIPILLDTLGGFFQSTQNMEEEIMLPTRLKDIPIDELIFDNSVQPDNWHEIYTFIRDMRNQLQCTYPFADDEQQNNAVEKQRQLSNEDEGMNVSFHDTNQFSSASSSGASSADDSEQNSTSSATPSYETMKDELKYHYYGLFRSLDNLTSLTNRVTDKYREGSNSKSLL